MSKMNNMRKRVKELKKRLHNQQGFTLIELMAVLAILAMIVLIAVPAIGSITENAEKKADDASIAMIEDAALIAQLGGGIPAEGATFDEVTGVWSAYDEDGTYTVQQLVNGDYLTIDESELAERANDTVVKNANGGSYDYVAAE